MSRETEAGHWYARMHGPDADSSRAAFDAWRRDPANAAAYAAYERDWALTGALSPAPRARTRAERQSARFAPGGRRWAMATAAAVVLALLFAWNSTRQSDTPQIASGPMLPGQLRLADGSTVTLMDGAWAEPQFSDSERRLRLHGGRARFKVAHDAARPFIVVAGNSETKALGTVFEVDTRAAAPRITLIEGSVEVRIAGTGKAIRLSPGESAEVATPGPRRLPAMTSPVRDTAIDADRLPLGAVIERANRANPVPIRLADPALAALELTGRFDVADSASLARKLAAALGLDVETHPGEIVLKRPREKRGD
ncbi:MAG: FecR domain-containing protein [Sphingopyxis sp.]|nr:FecR domain-containing protein [Sphingopyxis sp.]